MKKFLLITTALLVAIATPAMAFNQQVKPRIEINTVEHLICYPALDPTSHDPVVSVYLDLEFDDNNSWTAKVFNVRHHLRSGRFVDRSQQYDGKLSKEFDMANWSWTGASYKDPTVQMVGRLTKDVATGWHYSETIFHNGFKEEQLPKMDCT